MTTPLLASHIHSVPFYHSDKKVGNNTSNVDKERNSIFNGLETELVVVQGKAGGRLKYYIARCCHFAQKGSPIQQHTQKINETSLE